MRAAVLTAFDGPDSITVTEVPDPVAGADDLLLEVDAAAIGPWDVATTTGVFTAVGGQSAFPQVLGWDFSGTVLEVGSAVSGWQAGDSALGFSPQPWTGIGVFAQRVALPAAILAPVPEGLDSDRAASLPVVALTAEVAVKTAAVGEGSRVLVIGATGAVGGFVTQLASRHGARVIASVSASAVDDVRALGAAEAVDRSGDVAAQTLAAGGPVDAIIDLVGPPSWPSAIGALRPGGHFVTSIPGQMPELPEGATGEALGVQPDAAAVGALAEQVARGDLVARVGDVFALADVREAYKRSVTAGGAKTLLKP
jgi:NADPH:quinone reductase